MYLLDTNVVSELRKVRSGRADANVTAWASRVATLQLYLSVITVQELETGVLLKERQGGDQGAMLRAWLEEQVLPSFSGRILPVTLEIARKCAALNVPDPLPQRDGLIAATALEHGLTVVTRNIKDFSVSGTSLLNPWVPPEP